MPDILIRGVQFPTMEQAYKTLIVSYDGKVYEGVHPQPTAKKEEPIAEAVELPEHGNLIDADSLADDLLYDAELADRALNDMSLVGSEREYMQSEKDIKQNCAYYVSHAPVIVPADKEGAE